MLNRLAALAGTALIAGTAATFAQTPQPAAPQPAAPQSAAPQSASSKATDSLSVYFDSGSAALSTEADGVLDQAARTYREGKPIIMVVSGGSDTTGSAAVNLRLSQRRADNVLQGLVARGIPVDRFQVLAKGQTEPAVPDPEGTPEARNRRVEISWR